MHVYLHGFASSPLSLKGKLLSEWFVRHGKGHDFAAPDLPISPAEVMRLFNDHIHLTPADTVIGSSLGGFYATVLAERFGCHAVVLNPVVHASRDLAQRIGTNKNYHDGRSFEFSAKYVDELRSLEMGAITFPQRYFLVAATGDEVLDYNEMVAFYSGAKHLIIQGSDHGISDFEKYVSKVARFS